MSLFKKNVGKLIRELRIMKGKSQEQLAFDLDYNDSSYISKLENGKANFDAELIERIFALLNCEAENITVRELVVF